MLTNARAVAVPMKDGKGETFRMHGRLGGERCRLALGTQRKPDAQRLIHKIETAFAEGVASTLWPELQERLPRITFQALADDVGWKEPQLEPQVKPTWEQLRTEYHVHLLKEIAKGNMRDGTRDRYMQTIKLFDGYVKGKGIILLEEITKRVIENWKLHRIEEIKRKAFSRGATGYFLDTANQDKIDFKSSSIARRRMWADIAAPQPAYPPKTLCVPLRRNWGCPRTTLRVTNEVVYAR